MIECDTGLSAPRKARIEIIPLIDVIFFLLATFVLFTLSLQKIKLIDVQFPAAVDSKGSEDETTLFLQVSGDGTLYWKKGARSAAELITLAELRTQLEHYKRSVETPRVFIRSDRKAKFGEAVKVLDEVRSAKIGQISIETFATQTGS